MLRPVHRLHDPGADRRGDRSPGSSAKPEDAVAIIAIVRPERGRRLRPGIPRRKGAARAEADGGAARRTSCATARSSRSPAAELVPGDIVLLEAGNVVPADLRLIEAAQLRVEEAALTGESRPGREVESRRCATPTRRSATASTWPTAARSSPTAAARRVVATGMATELGRIATLLATTEEVRTPLQKRLAHFGRAALAAPRSRSAPSSSCWACCAARRGGADVPHRGEPRGRRHPRGAAGGGHDRARARRAARW